MKVLLELRTARVSGDGTFPLVIRFSINRKAYRYQTGIRMTPEQWSYEVRHGHINSFNAVELHKKSKKILDIVNPLDFNMDEFNRLMKAPAIATDPVTKWYDAYLEYRNKQRLKVRTRELDDCAIKKIKEFLISNPTYDDVFIWDRDQLNELFDFMVDEEGGDIAVATAGIYLRNFSAFFNWLMGEKDFVMKDPFRKYKIPKYKNSWFPYSNSELAKILTVNPTTDPQRQALLWIKLIVYSGGTDMKDFAEMTWRQVHSEVIQMQRVKVENSSDSSKKLLYISDLIREIFDQLKIKKGKQDDYVFGIYKKDKTENQNLEFLKAKMNNINASMNEMLEELDKERVENKLKPLGIHFTIKRLRPTAATIANNSTKDLNFVKNMLQHANLKQTDTYVKNTPSEINKANQDVFEKALLKISEPGPSESSAQRSSESRPDA